MDAQQYSLSWNHFHSNLSTGFQSLLREQDLVDVTLAVEGKYFKAHKMVLSICSPYFKELFHATPCKHPIVLLQDVQYQIMKSLLVFMYQGEVKVSQADLPAFMRLAENLKVKGLTEDDGQEMETEKRLISNQNQKKETNGLFPPFSHIEEQSAPRQRQFRPKHFKSLTPPPSTSVQTCTLPKRSAEAFDNKLESQLPEKKSKDTLLAIRLEALQAHQEIVAHQQRQKELEKQRRAVLRATTSSLASISAGTTDNQTLSSIGRESELLPVKEEPVEFVDVRGAHAQDDMEQEQEHMMMDMGSIVATSLGDGGEDMEGGQTETGDTSTPGRVMVLRSRRGLPVAIHDGHIYTKHKVEPTRTTWLCVKQRNLQCGGCLTTDISEQNALSFSGHNHRQLHDIIQRLQTAGSNTLGLGSGSSNCGSSSNSSPSHSHDPLEPTDLSLSSTAPTQTQSSHL